MKLSPSIVTLRNTVRIVGELLESDDFDSASLALDLILRDVTAIRNQIAAATAPELTPEERAAQEHERALIQAREEGRKQGIEDTRLWGEKDVLTFNPYMELPLRDAWQEGYEQGRVIPF